MEINEEIIEEIQGDANIYDDDVTLEHEVVGKIYDRGHILNNEKMFKILKLGRNQWNKPFLIVLQDDDPNEYILNLSKTVYNQLIDKLGNKAGEWKGKTVKFFGKPFKSEIKGQIKEGVELVLA